ncbi:hypothetical protein SERLA73DRAFT_37257, partial [Serpula lacrymans var. lacrymans S7.3]
LTEMITMWEQNPAAKPSNRQQKHAMRLLNRLKLAAKDLKGSFGYKLCRCNEIRALIKKLGMPALFITLNPADIYNPLLGIIAGLSHAQWQQMSAFQQGVFVANHPGAAAEFFDTMIKSFL